VDGNGHSHCTAAVFSTANVHDSMRSINLATPNRRFSSSNVVVAVAATLLLLLTLLPSSMSQRVASEHPPSSTLQLSYIDGIGAAECRSSSKFEQRVTGNSGLIFSHQPYGDTYRRGKNCFLMITVPSGYRIRIRALDFYVLGNPTNCAKDSLHIFDHDRNIDDLDKDVPENISPGPIIGQFCGLKPNGSDLAISMHNAVTLWWHTNADLPEKHDGRGFRLHWSAFRNSSNGGICSRRLEFRCRNMDCIPLSLACDRFADCRDESDIDPIMQREYQCADIREDDILDSLHGVQLLIICIVVVVGSVFLCVAVCICCRSLRRPINGKQTTIMRTSPMRQQQQCPAPPALPPPTYSPSRTPAASSSTPSASVPPISAVYGSPADTRNHYDNISEYAYAKNSDVTRKLLPPTTRIL
jgi:hypothetical protein